MAQTWGDIPWGLSDFWIRYRSLWYSARKPRWQLSPLCALCFSWTPSENLKTVLSLKSCCSRRGLLCENMCLGGMERYYCGRSIPMLLQGASCTSFHQRPRTRDLGPYLWESICKTVRGIPSDGVWYDEGGLSWFIRGANQELLSRWAWYLAEDFGGRSKGLNYDLLLW